MKKLFTLTLSFLGFFSIEALAQDVAVKSNLLYDATTTINVGLEFGLGAKSTLDLSGSYNPWTFSDNQKMKLWLVQPEYRWWTCQAFAGHFFGVHAHGGEYNWGGMLPWGIKNAHMDKYRYEGWLIGAGASYGYHWILGNRWGLEATIGLGYAYMNYSKYPCEKCGKKLGDDKKHYLGPTKAGISLIYIIK